MKRDLKKAYIFAAIMSIVLYSVGIFTGLYIQKSTISITEKRIETLQRRVESAQLEYVYISTLGDRINCDAISTLVDDTTKDVRNIGRELTNLENKEKIGDKFDTLKRDYAILSTRGWILNSYIEGRCNKNIVPLLYFYSIPCQECEQQGHILDLLGNEFKDKLLVFVLDVNVEEPIVNTLEKSYNVKATPSIVIGNTTYQGLQTEDLLKGVILKQLSS